MTLDRKNRRLRTLSKQQFAKVIRAAMLDDNMGAGVQITGTTGSGKSNIGEWLFDQMVRLGMPCMYFDPHGTSAKKLLRMSADWPARCREKLLYIRPADSNYTIGINPLWIDTNDLSDYDRDSKICSRVEQTAQIIFSVFGETAFGSRPVLRKWMTRWLTVLAKSGLTLADALLFIDPHNPIYELLLQLVPDQMARHQMEALTSMKLVDLEAEIGSARNRITAVLEHPRCQTLFSRRTNVLDMRWVYDNDISIIWDLEQGDDLLTDDAQQLICNLILHQYLATVIATPESQRRRRLCFIDELPLFESSAPILMKMSTEIRKFMTKFAFLHQGSARFPGRHDNEFFNTITDMCRVHLFFRHAAADARYFGEQVTLATWNDKKVKHVHKTPQQFTEGHQLVHLRDHTEGAQEADATGTTDGTTDQLTDTLTRAVANAQTRPDTITPNGLHVPSHSQTETNSRGQSRASGSQHSLTNTRTTTRNVSSTVKQTLIPKIVTKDIVSSIQFYTPEEIDRDVAATIKQFDTGEAYLQIDGLATYLVQTPEARDRTVPSPKFAVKKLRQFLVHQHQRPDFTSPAEIQRERQEFLDRLVDELDLMLAASQGRIIEGHTLKTPLISHDQPPLDFSASQDDDTAIGV